MTTINITRPEISNNFTSLPNEFFNFGRNIKGLKPRDSSVLHYLLSKPAHWKVVAKDIAVGVNISINTVYAALSTLQKLGIASYTRDKSGYTKWQVSIPQDLYSPADKPYTEKPHEKNGDLITKNENIEKKQKTTTTDHVKSNFTSMGDSSPTDYINEPTITTSFTPTNLVDQPIVKEAKENITSQQSPIENELKSSDPETISKSESPIEKSIEESETITTDSQSAEIIETKNEFKLPEILSDIEKATARKSIIKANLDKIAIEVALISLNKAADSGTLRSPLAYLNSLINKAKDGTLDTRKHEQQSNMNSTQSDAERRSPKNRKNEIRRFIAESGCDALFLQLITENFVNSKSIGYIHYDEVKELGLLEESWIKRYSSYQLERMQKMIDESKEEIARQDEYAAKLKAKKEAAIKAVPRMSPEEFEAARNSMVERAEALLKTQNEEKAVRDAQARIEQARLDEAEMNRAKIEEARKAQAKIDYAEIAKAEAELERIAHARIKQAQMMEQALRNNAEIDYTQLDYSEAEYAEMVKTKERLEKIAYSRINQVRTVNRTQRDQTEED